MWRVQVQEPDRDERERDRELEREPDAWRHDQVEEDDRRADREQRERVAEPPHHTEPGRAEHAARARGDGRDRDDVVRIGGVADAERETDPEQRDGVHDREP